MIQEDILKDTMIFSKRLRAIIRERHMTHEEFADICGVSRNCVASWMQGRTFPSGYSLAIAANALGCSMEYLFGLELFQDVYDQIKKDTIDEFAGNLKLELIATIDRIVKDMKGEQNNENI